MPLPHLSERKTVPLLRNYNYTYTEVFIITKHTTQISIGANPSIH